MTASQRIRKIIDTKKISIKFFCEQTGINRDTLNQMFRKDSDPRLKLIQKVMLGFPELNPIWLILGEGEMWVSDSGKDDDLAKDVMDIKEQLKKINERLEKEL